MTIAGNEKRAVLASPMTSFHISEFMGSGQICSGEASQRRLYAASLQEREDQKTVPNLRRPVRGILSLPTYSGSRCWYTFDICIFRM